MGCLQGAGFTTDDATDREPPLENSSRSSDSRFSLQSRNHPYHNRPADPQLTHLDGGTGLHPRLEAARTSAVRTCTRQRSEGSAAPIPAERSRRWPLAVSAHARDGSDRSVSL